MIITAVLAAVEKTINGLLPLDPEMQDELSELSGRVVQLTISDIDVTVFARIRRHRILLTENYDGVVDAKIIGTTTVLLKNYRRGFSVGSGVEVEGKVDLVKQLNSIMNRFQIDWEELLSRIVGDIAAHKIHGALTDFIDWGKDAGDRLRMDVSEFVHEEVRITPSKQELEDFYSDVADVRDGVERAQAKINWLRSKLCSEE